MIGKVIKDIRELKGTKQSVFADNCGITKVYLSYVESNKRTPSLDLLQKMFNELDIPLSILTFLSLDGKTVKYKEEYKDISAIVDKLLLALVKEKLDVV